MTQVFPGDPLILTIDKGKQASFKDTKSVMDWCERESAAWRVLDGSSTGRPADAFRKIDSILQSVHGTAVAYQGRPDHARLADLTGALGTLSSHIAHGSYIISNSPLGRYILEFTPSDNDLASAIYIVATKGNGETLPSTKLIILATGFLANFYSGVGTKAASASIKSVQDSAASFSELMDDGTKKLKHLTDVLADEIVEVKLKTQSISDLLVKSIKSKRTHFERERKGLVEATKKETEECIQDAKDSIAEFRDFMEKQISLQVPARYWADKRDRHRNATVISAIIFLAYVCVVVSYTWSNIIAKYQDVFGFLENWRDAGLGVVGVMAGALALVLIFARVLYRMFASQLHLWNDAGERVTMIETYLALAEKGHAKEEFLGALMGRLFLPASDGIVRDDLGSVGPIDLASKLAGSRT